MVSWTFENTKDGYAKMWGSMVVQPNWLNAANAAARKIMAHEDEYMAVQQRTGVPWYFIGLLHMRESGNDFRGVLHNGEHIIGTGRKTKLVPRGRGPFNTWEEAAIDALTMPPHELHKVKQWSPARMAYEAERYNGLGYVFRGINSPYVWSGSNHYTHGKFVADGRFDPTATDQQLGVMPVLARLAEMDASIKQELSDDSQQRPASSPVA